MRSWLWILVIGCTDSPPDPADEPVPAPAPEVKLEKPPGPGDDALKEPGAFGKVTVDVEVETEDGEVRIEQREVPIEGWSEVGSLRSSSARSRQYWDEVHPFEKCPESPVHVYDAASEESRVRKCADNKGYAALCDLATDGALRRAVNVVKSCRRAPSCDGRITASGMEWNCRGGVFDDGFEFWSKGCWAQFRVDCIAL